MLDEIKAEQIQNSLIGKLTDQLKQYFLQEVQGKKYGSEEIYYRLSKRLDELAHEQFNSVFVGDILLLLKRYSFEINQLKNMARIGQEDRISDVMLYIKQEVTNNIKNLYPQEVS